MTSYSLKLKLFKSGEKEKKCEKCQLENWNDLPIPLEMHHIDGNSLNNDLSNLQILCPNCHSQTKNFRSRNRKIPTKNYISEEDMIAAINSSYTRREALLKCGLSGKGASYDRINRLLTEKKAALLIVPISEKTLKTIESIRKKYGSYQKMFNAKITWPEKDVLTEMIKSKSMTQIAKELGVSASGIKKHAQKIGIDVRAISPWAKHGKKWG